MKFLKDIITRKRQDPDESETVDLTDQFDPAEPEDNSGDDLLVSLASIQSKIQGALNGTDRDSKKSKREDIDSSPVEDFADVVAEFAKPEIVELKQKAPDTVSTVAAVNAGPKEAPKKPEKKFKDGSDKEQMLATPVVEPVEPKTDIRKVQDVPIQDKASPDDIRNPTPIKKPQGTQTNLETEGPKIDLKPVASPGIIEVPAPSTGRSGRRAGRVKTRLLGFEKSQDSSADPFDSSKKVTGQAQVDFPVGWIVVISGPGRGASFSIFNGVSQIGRGEDQAIKLDFGDNSISRNNHAAIAYDNEQRSFFLGHGGKANLVRLNDKPVLSTEEISNSDLIRIGETTLRFVALCGNEFDWEVDNQEEFDDAAIA